MNKKVNWEDIVSDIVFALALLQVAILNQWGPSVLLPVAVAQVMIARLPKKSVYNEGGWHGFVFLLGAVIMGDIVLNLIFNMMMSAKCSSTVAVMAAVLVMVYSAIKTAWAVVSKRAEIEVEETCEVPDDASGLVGLCRDENGKLMVCLGLVEDGQAIVYDQGDPEAKTYIVFASNLIKVD